MSKDPYVYVGHILESIQDIEMYMQGVTRGEFLANSEKQSAVTWKLVVIGESAANIPDEFRAEYPAVPWVKIKAARNILVHEYFRIDREEVWKIVERDLPILKKLLQQVLTGQSHHSPSGNESES